ncbi:MAG: hypothetical protein K9H25_17355 [Rhodospirillum sp.]|nr:hypothetical protein [Rhodospirillum sp.]
MNVFAKTIGNVILVAAGVFLLLPLGTLFGGLTGWFVGLFFGDTILGIARQLGVDGVNMFQLGAFAGFFGTFLRSTTSDRD